MAAPATSTPASATTVMYGEVPKSQVDLKLKTITKYSYFESGEKWVKVLLPDLAGLKDHPADKVKIEFPTNRSFSVTVYDFKG